MAEIKAVRDEIVRFLPNPELHTDLDNILHQVIMQIENHLLASYKILRTEYKVFINQTRKISPP